MKKILYIVALGVFSAHAGIMDGNRLNSSLYFKTLGSGEVRTTVLALPEVYRMRLSRDMSLDAVSIPVLATSSGDNSTIARIANTKVRAVYNYRDMALATLGIKVPLGINRFDANQEKTAGFLGTRQFGFKNANLYNTFDISASASSSIAFQDMGPGDLSVGCGLAYLMKLPFRPTEADRTFNPGDEFSVSLAGEYNMMLSDRKVRTIVDLGFTLYGSDKLGDDITTDVGGQFNWSVVGDTEIADLPVSLRLANYIKGANKEDRVGSTTKKSNDFITAVRAGLPVLPEYAPYGLLRLSYYGGGNLYDNNAFVTTLGGGGKMRLSERMFANGELGLDFGGYGDAGIFGISLEGGVNYVF